MPFIDQIKVGSTTRDIQDTGARTNEGTLSNLTTTEKTNLVGAINELKAESSNLLSHINLNVEEIPDTVQSITFDAAGNVDTITHTRDNVVIRTDEFTFGANTITEVRTLNTGESLTIVTNTTTLETTVTYAAA